MHRTFLTLGILLALAVAIGGGVFLIMSLTTSPEAPLPDTLFPNPNSTVDVTPGTSGPDGVNGSLAGNKVTYVGQAGYPIEASDLMKDPDLFEDQYNPGFYLLGYHYDDSEETVEDPPYLIQYIPSTYYFNVTLLKEPIAQTRRDAETYLMQRLGISEESLCYLQYDVAVPNSVNAIYAAEGLGFSFCEGATPL